MKIISVLFLFFLIVFAGCSTTQEPAAKPAASKTASAPPKDPAETVLVTYHVKAGMEQPFEALLANAWKTYRGEHLVFAEPHVIIREIEENRHVVYVEIFTWVNHAAPGNAPASVKEIWAQEGALCEKRGGVTAISGGEVEPIVPPRK